MTTDSGLEGGGEAFGFRAVASAKLAVDELIAPICIGQDAKRIAPLMLEVQNKLHVFGRAGALSFAISAVDIALWDANSPLTRFIGGGFPDLACYASLVRFSDPSLVRVNFRRAIDGGFHSLELHEIELPAIWAAREEAGPDVELMVDVNCAWNHSYQLGWFVALQKLQQVLHFGHVTEISVSCMQIVRQMTAWLRTIGDLPAQLPGRPCV